MAPLTRANSAYEVMVSIEIHDTPRSSGSMEIQWCKIESMPVRLRSPVSLSRQGSGTIDGESSSECNSLAIGVTWDSPPCCLDLSWFRYNPRNRLDCKKAALAGSQLMVPDSEFAQDSSDFFCGRHVNASKSNTTVASAAIQRFSMVSSSMIDT